MTAPLLHPVVPAALEPQEIARAAADVAPDVYLDLDALDQHKFQAVRQRLSTDAWGW